MASVFCLHGFLGLPSDWDFLDDHASGAELRKIDVLSLGEDWALELNELAIQFAGPRVLLGYSMGGRLALQALTRNPSIWDGAILVSANPGIPETARAARQIEDERWAERFETLSWEEVTALWDSNPVFGGKPSPLPRRESDFDRAKLARALRLWSTANQQDLRAKLSGVKTPVLWVTGARDEKYREIAAQLRSSGLNMEFWEAEDAAHRVPWEAPEAFQEHFRGFLRRILLGGSS